LEAELNLDPDPNPDPESDPELITVPDPNLQIISDPEPDAQHCPYSTYTIWYSEFDFCFYFICGIYSCIGKRILGIF
jgi:hypothetical protein